MMEKIASDAADAMVGKKESAIHDAIVALIGPAWTMDQVKRRCRMVRVSGSPLETLYIDGKPAIEFGPIEHETVQKDDRYLLRLTQSVRHLWRAEDQQER